MREIKFRGKRLDNGEWVYGYFVSVRDIEGNDHACIHNTFGGFQYVIPETVGQFTGLLDKNGKEIYEGDVYRFEHPDSVNEVSFSIGGGFAGWDFSPAFTDAHKLTDIEVIGNIHDNPELLKP